MARTINAADLILLDSPRFTSHVRLMLENPSGVLVDMTSLNGIDHFVSVAWQDSVDDMCVQGSAELVKIASGQSIVPLDQNSLVNRSGSTYAPFLRSGQQVRVDIAITAVGAAPVTWYTFFAGRVDDVDVDQRQIARITFRDFGGILADLDMPDEITYAQQSLEARVQAVLDQQLGAGVVTLVVPVPTGRVIPAGPMPGGFMLEALRKLARENGSFDLRYKWHEPTQNFWLTLYAPDLVSVTPQHTLNPTDDYISVDELKIGRDNVFNIVRVIYPSGFVTANSLASIAAYGPRFTLIDSAAGVVTSADATAVATAALEDLKEPIWSHQITNLFYPVVDLRDVIGFGPHADLYSTQQNWSVVSISHQLTAKTRRTVIRVRGKAMLGGSSTWGAGGGVDQIVIENILTSYKYGNINVAENLLAQAPGYDPNPAVVLTQADTLVVPMAYLSRILRVGDRIAAYGEINQTNAADWWVLAFRFYDANNVLISEVYNPNPLTGTSGQFNPANTNQLSLFDPVTGLTLGYPIPAGTEFIGLGIKGSGAYWTGAPAGTATWRKGSISRGPLATPYNETETLRSSEVRRAIMIALGQAQGLEWLAGSGGAGNGGSAPSGAIVGVPNNSVSTQTIVDAVAAQTILDTLLREINNLVSIEGTGTLTIGQATIDDGLAPRPVLKGHLQGLAKGGLVGALGWIDGTAITFTSLFGSAPVVTLLIARSPDPRRLKWSAGFDPSRPVFPEIVPLNVAPGSFTPRARWVQIAATYVASDNNFPGTVLDGVNDATEVTITDAPAIDNRYFINMAGTYNANGSTGVPESVSITLQLEAQFDGANWNTLYQRNFVMVAEDALNNSFVTNVSANPQWWARIPGLKAGDKLRIFVSAFSASNGGTMALTGVDVLYTSQPEVDVPVDDNFGAGTLNSVGANLAVTLSAAPSATDKYELRWTTTLAAGGQVLGGTEAWGTSSVEVAVDSSSDGGSNWVERLVKSRSVNAPDNTPNVWNEVEEVTVSGLSVSAPADKFRIRIKSMTVGSTSLPDPFLGLITVTGSVDVDPNDCQYVTASGGRSFASMTPNQEADPNERCRWTAASAQ